MEAKTILIQGAMDIEISCFLENMIDSKFENIAGYEFYKGTINNKNVIISKTLIGTINSTIATTIGVTNFHPSIVINQGISGAHREDLHRGDIIVGEKCCNINSYSMPSKQEKEGSNSLEWEPNKRAKEVQYANIEIVNKIYQELVNESKNRIYIGTLGSGDCFNKEYDRIKWITNVFKNDCEDMESIGTYSVCNKFNIPCVGIRIISNNELLFEKIDKEKAIDLQKSLMNIIEKKI